MKIKLKYLSFFIPLIGIVYALYIIINGLSRKIKLDILIGFLGIFINIYAVFLLVKFTYYNKEAIKSRTSYAKYNMSKLGKFIELYKLKYKHYPDSIEKLNEFEAQIWYIDPFVMKMFEKDASNFYLNYSKKDTSFVLFSVGLDKIANTKDDIYYVKPTHFGTSLP